jgi:uncharacterized membrane protein YgdD (TMEM256/DUF423 family)
MPMPLAARLFLVVGALSAAAAVALGAAGAHAFASRPAHALALFQTALQYHQLHAIGLLVVGLVVARGAGAAAIAAGWLMLAGTLLFSGNLYLRSLADYHALHAVTPWGGGAFILGWLALAFGAVRQK